MNFNNKKVISFLVIVIFLVLLLTVSFVIAAFYLDSMVNRFNSKNERLLDKHIKTKKIQSELRLEQLRVLLEDKNNHIEQTTQQELEQRVQNAFISAKAIYERYKNSKSSSYIKQKIIETLAQFKNQGDRTQIFIKDFNENIILANTDKIDKELIVNYEKITGRSLILEEMQKVRKRGAGSFLTDLSPTKIRVTYVKKLDIYDWFLGASKYMQQSRQKLKLDLLNMIKSISLTNSDFIVVYEDRKVIFLSPKMNEKVDERTLNAINKNLINESKWHQDKLGGLFYYNTYFEPFHWHIVSGFNIRSKLIQISNEEKQFVISLEKKLQSIIEVAFLVIVFTIILLLFLRKKRKSNLV